jgi:hypothetical protein
MVARFEQVQAKLAASVDATGKPLKGMKGRVAACRDELARLTAARIAAGTESGG